MNRIEGKFDFNKFYEEARKKVNPAEKAGKPSDFLAKHENLSPGEEKFLSGERGHYEWKNGAIVFAKDIEKGQFIDLEI